MPVRFFYEEIDFKIPNPLKIRHWIDLSSKREGRKIGQINYVFCSDAYLLKLNQTYLQHQTLTDIITFDDSDETRISGDIYISLDRVAENADQFSNDFLEELRRVMIHGVLHMCGYKDKGTTAKKLMRKKEDAYLSLWDKLFHVKRKG